MMEYNRVGHCQKGTSDKVYVVRVGCTTAGSYAVDALWGRRGNINQKQGKGVFPTKHDAQKQMERLFSSKVKKGYVNIESKDYSGPVTIDSVSGCLVPEDSYSPLHRYDHEEVEPTNPVSLHDDDDLFEEYESEVEVELEATCMDNIGMEDSFLIGVSYLVEKNQFDSDMIYVFDRFGEKRDCYKERFKMAKN